MTLTPSEVKRAIDVSGDNIKTFTDALNKKIQAIALVDDNGNQIGTAGSPLTTSTTTLNLTLYIPSYDANSNPLYLCQATPGIGLTSASWQIFKLAYDVNGNVTQKRWADGDSNFDKIATSYATYDYTDI